MFQASVESGLNIQSSEHLSFNWFIRNVSTSPFSISGQRVLVARDSLTWSPPVGSLPTGLKLIEFQVTLSNVSTALRDYGFLKVEEANLIAVISGGSEKLRSSNHPIRFDGSDSSDPGIGPGDQDVEMTFNWSCLDGGDLLHHVFSGNKVVALPSDRARKRARRCSRNVFFKSDGSAVSLINPLNEHIYYMKLVVRKARRRAEFVQTVYAADENVLKLMIR